jgi:aminopeptidase N
MRGARAGLSVAAATAVLLVSGCTSSAKPVAHGSSSAPVVAPSSVVPLPSVPTSAPLPQSSGSHHYLPGGASIGDSLFPHEGDTGYDATHYGITIGYDPAATRLTGDTVVTATATQDLGRFDLDLVGLQVQSVAVNNVPVAAFARVGNKLVITPTQGINKGASYTTRVVYGGVPVDHNDPQLGEEGLVPSGPGAIAQGEPEGASSWYPVNDHPLDKATYDITITAPSDLSALSNGVLVSKMAVGATTTWHWSEDKPMASYLAMVVIGKYRVVNSTHNGIPVVVAVDKSLPTTVDAQVARTPEIVDFLATQFGPYPFDAEGAIVHNEPKFRFALENQTRPVYSYVFFQHGGDQTHTIAHELAHQWYGDSVSVADWKDVWLNEGFATYAEWLWNQHEGGETPKQMFDEIYNGKGSLDPGATAEPTVATLFGDEVYGRGGATLEALRITVGDAAFFKIIRAWAADRKYGNGSTAQFIALADKVSGKSLDSFFKPWLFEKGKPPYPKRLS